MRKFVNWTAAIIAIVAVVLIVAMLAFPTKYWHWPFAEQKNKATQGSPAGNPPAPAPPQPAPSDSTAAKPAAGKQGDAVAKLQAELDAANAKLDGLNAELAKADTPSHPPARQPYVATAPDGKPKITARMVILAVVGGKTDQQQIQQTTQEPTQPSGDAEPLDPEVTKCGHPHKDEIVCEAYITGPSEDPPMVWLDTALGTDDQGRAISAYGTRGQLSFTGANNYEAQLAPGMKSKFSIHFPVESTEAKATQITFRLRFSFDGRNKHGQWFTMPVSPN